MCAAGLPDGSEIVCHGVLQDGSEIVCHGVDVLNTETQEVITALPVHFISPVFSVHLWSYFVDDFNTFF